MLEVLKSPIVMIVISMTLGQIIGQLEIKHMKLGSSATLFVALFISYISATYLNTEISVDKTVFLISLIGFIVSVGLIAASSVSNTMKQYGLKFMILSFFITGTGALSTYFLLGALRENAFKMIGTYVGALTSSPGLASALELAGNSSADVGLGYSIAYIPGVLLVILFTQLMGMKHKNKHCHHLVKKSNDASFNLMAFSLVILFGILLGSFKLRISDSITLSFGMTGGVLISALILGSRRKILGLSFEFCHKRLSVIRDLSLNMFLAVVGLNYGYKAVLAIHTSGFNLLIAGIMTGSLSIIVGLFVGRYLLKIETTYLIGGICGGMTSTPGLASALDCFDEDKVVTGYGATYPFALIFMIVFTNLLFLGG